MHIFLFVFVFREVKESTQLLNSNMAERKFNRVEKDKCSLSEKDELVKLCVKYKEEFNKKIIRNKSTVNFNERQKKHTTKLLWEGYIARAVQEYYKDLEGLRNDDPVMKKAVKLGKRCYD